MIDFMELESLARFVFETKLRLVNPFFNWPSIKSQVLSHQPNSIQVSQLDFILKSQIKFSPSLQTNSNRSIGFDIIVERATFRARIPMASECLEGQKCNLSTNQNIWLAGRLKSGLSANHLDSNSSVCARQQSSFSPIIAISKSKSRPRSHENLADLGRFANCHLRRPFSTWPPFGCVRFKVWAEFVATPSSGFGCGGIATERATSCLNCLGALIERKGKRIIA